MKKLLSVLTFILVGIMFFGELIVYTSVDEANARKILTKFSKDTGIKVKYIFLSSGPALARLEAEKNNPQADIWFGAPMSNHIIAKERDLTISYKSQFQAIESTFYDKEGYYHAFYMNPIGIGVNLSVMEQIKADIPKTWEDLSKSEYQNMIQYPNPQSSGTAYSLITGLISIYGEKGAMEYLKQIAPNVQSYTQSGTGPSKTVGVGQAGIGIQFTPAFFQFKEQGYPVDVVFPAKGVPYESACLSIVKGTKNIDESKKLVDWILSKQGQQAIVDEKTYFYPVRKDVDFGTLQPLSTIKLISVDEKWAAENKKRIIDDWVNEVLPVK
ncbi:ABC transporter substrate-binding protein [Oceanotoga sp. DSM 15011]|jgi:iron(III) transport system substrate-binding protein|uniref:Iron(III) transport system substrate-binding protein n=1 Tax=Oceanotoga teriensis TaxID=515440 RepID=A0AA45HHN7_9BACT|nr:MULTISPECIES: ABC transporter substrate-binding protein [Oceanotoga]MDN5341959.1 iron(III) transport system substrate-binding protein [Oceanotoga sp.]MDO7976523.1 ABC transporter substrate-binding protein [Oceanotoga teriensis]PWJ87881.1 iron(III) transport system substrate-binding protein [Oceanotoga teriensis]UYO99238.1 ABC transporter substrate-binding protein [Oceanotoga sp. DSM 15011]